jgi:hypothetical protein
MYYLKNQFPTVPGIGPLCDIRGITQLLHEVGIPVAVVEDAVVVVDCKVPIRGGVTRVLGAGDKTLASQDGKVSVTWQTPHPL